jgi:hypothetical protein
MEEVRNSCDCWFKYLKERDNLEDLGIDGKENNIELTLGMA